MALLDDYNAIASSGLQPRIAVSVSRAVFTVLARTTPPPTVDEKALAKRFMLSPENEAQRYLLPVIARLLINGVTVSTATDAQLQTAVNEVLAANVTLLIA